ncbi:MAG TPA: ECF-type sigma factor [Blastocatellia bacterium]
MEWKPNSADRRRLSVKDPRMSLVVELRYFGGPRSIEETAEALGVLATTVKRELTMAKAWLGCEMQRGLSQ